MLVERIDAQHIKPVADPFHVLEAQVPSARTVGLAQRPFATKLIGHARKLLDGPSIAELGVRILAVLVHQRINRRPLVPGVHRHVVGTVGGARPPVFPVVAGELQPVLFTVVVARLSPALDELLQQDLVVIVAYPFPVADRPGHCRQMVFETVAPSLLELLGQVFVPRQGAHEGVRLIGEDARHPAAKVFADLSPVRLEGDLNELLGHARFEQVNIVLATVPAAFRGQTPGGHEVAALGQLLPGFGRARHVLVSVSIKAVDREDVVAGLSGLLDLGQVQAPASRLGHRLGNESAGEARRVRVLIVDPDVHVEPLRFL